MVFFLRSMSFWVRSWYFKVSAVSELDDDAESGRLGVEEGFFVLDDVVAADRGQQPHLIERVLLLLLLEVADFDLR